MISESTVSWVLSLTMAYRVKKNQENHFDGPAGTRTIIERQAANFVKAPRLDLSKRRILGLQPQGEVSMSGQVVLYFEDQADALRFALAAGSVMAGEGGKFTSTLVQETARVTRIRLDAVNAGSAKKPNPIRAA